MPCGSIRNYLTVTHSQVLNQPAGNWDNEFVDNPAVLDVDRNTRGHLGFGYGVHQCIGQNLARACQRVTAPADAGDALTTG